MDNFVKTIQLAKDGSQKDMLKIIEKMQPLLRKYAGKVYDAEFEDMVQELTIALIEAVQKIKVTDNRNQCLAYLVTGVKHRYYESLRKTLAFNNEVHGADKDIGESVKGKSEDGYTEMELQVLLEEICILRTETDKKIFRYVTQEHLSDKEIAEYLGVSRQYVNRCKRKIFEPLKQYYRVYQKSKDINSGVVV